MFLIKLLGVILGKRMRCLRTGMGVRRRSRQLLYSSVENWTRFNYDNKKHWNDTDMQNPFGWQPPTALI